MTEPLHISLEEASMNKIGGEGHIEIAGILRQSKKNYFGDEMFDVANQIWEKSAWSIESNLDLIKWPTEPTWYEMPGTLINDDATVLGQIGFLVIPYPGSESQFMIMTGFESQVTTARHCYAMALVDSSSLSVHSRRARKVSNRDDNVASMSRILDQIGVGLNPEFREEILILSEGNSEAVEAAMRDATGNIPLLLCTLLSMSASNTLMKVTTDEEDRLVPLPRAERSKLGKLADRIRRRSSSGFVRIDRLWRRPEVFLFA